MMTTTVLPAESNALFLTAWQSWKVRDAVSSLPERGGADALPSAWGGVVTRHPATGAVERRTALAVNHREIRNVQNLRRSGALQGAVR